MSPEQRVRSLAVSGAGLETSIGAVSTPQWRRHLDARRPRDWYVPAWASAPSRSAGLSPREWDVLALIITGRSNRVIAARLGISPNTVHKHVTTILDKLGARSRSQAIAVALDLEALGSDWEAG